MRSGLTIAADDDDFDRRPQRRRYEEPLAAVVRRQLLTIAESVGFNLPSRFYHPGIGMTGSPSTEFT